MRSVHHSLFPARRVAAERERSVSVLLPARNEAGTIGAILEDLLPLIDEGVVDQVAVLDDSCDGTAEIARAVGAEVFQQSEIKPEYGPVQGKGDAMWRGLSVASGEVVCFLDADSESFGPHYACGLVGLVACPGPVRFAKGYYRRPFRSGGMQAPSGGGRVTELMARPLLERFFPELGVVRQPLAGEVAAERDVLERLPFPCGYSVDIALLIDAWRLVGLDNLGQVDLDVRQNRHRPLHELGPMAHAVLSAVTDRLECEGRLTPDGASTLLQRPPLVTLGAYPGAAEHPTGATGAHL